MKTGLGIFHLRANGLSPCVRVGSDQAFKSVQIVVAPFVVVMEQYSSMVDIEKRILLGMWLFLQGVDISFLIKARGIWY